MRHASVRHENHESENNVHILDVLNSMHHFGLESEFIFSLMDTCQEYEGIRDLMEMWYYEKVQKERAKIIADLQDCLEDIKHAPRRPKKRSLTRGYDLEEIRKDISKFKQYLREQVDRHGGISELARKTGIPQPSLSRFFSSKTMPRRTTLYKIGKVLKIPESALGFKWSI